MTSIRIAIAAVLAAAVVCVGGASHATDSGASTATHTAALDVRPVPQGPVLCCD
jgi:hypothetical protein